jgi:hypothetical protein
MFCELYKLLSLFPQIIRNDNDQTWSDKEKEHDGMRLHVCIFCNTYARARAVLHMMYLACLRLSLHGVWIRHVTYLHSAATVGVLKDASQSPNSPEYR